jgi:hypothetical protein
LYQRGLSLLQALVSVVAAVAVAAVLKCMFSRPSFPVYLVDFAVHKGLDEWKFSKDLFIPMSAQTGVSICGVQPHSGNSTWTGLELAIDAVVCRGWQDMWYLHAMAAAHGG